MILYTSSLIILLDSYFDDYEIRLSVAWYGDVTATHRSEILGKNSSGMEQ